MPTAPDSLGLLLRARCKGPRRLQRQAALAALDVFQPAVVLLDVGMPELDGYEVARRIRARAGFHDLTIIAITGWGQAEDHLRSREAGFDAHLTKPPDLEQLKQLLLSSGDRARRRERRRNEVGRTERRGTEL